MAIFFTNVPVLLRQALGMDWLALMATFLGAMALLFLPLTTTAQSTRRFSALFKIPRRKTAWDVLFSRYHLFEEKGECTLPTIFFAFFNAEYSRRRRGD